MLTLSRLVLDAECPAVQRDLANPYEQHRTLLQAFGCSRAEAGMLHRLEREGDRPVVLVQSCREPDWQRLPDHYAGPDCVLVKHWVPELVPGQALRFRLRANPTLKRGRRRHAWSTTADQVAWLARQLAGNGAEVVDAMVAAEGRVRMRLGWRGRRVTTYSVLFEGVLRVACGDALRQAIVTGVGPGKAFGMGLLSVAPPSAVWRV